MRVNKVNDTRLVVAAQAGDRQALDDLTRAYLPFVYTIVRRALGGHADADDIVQESMLRALRELGELRAPDSFRAWLASITVRQISTHLHRRSVSAPRSASLDDLIETPDADGPFEELTMLNLSLSDQRRQVRRAARWLGDDERIVLSLWWLEVAGHLTRAELATAIGVSVAHAAVRVQRMRQQLDQCRALVAALDLQPRCAGLGALIVDWNGVPGPQWRRRIVRHLKACAVCERPAGQLLPADRLLVGFALLAVPLGLTGALAGKTALIGSTTSAALTGATKAGLVGHLTHVFAAHPISAAVLAATLITGAAVVNWPAPTPSALPSVTASRSPAVTRLPSPSPLAPSPTSSPRPSATVRSPEPSPARSLAVGAASLEALNGAGLFVTTADGLGVLAALSPADPIAARQQATFEAVAGVADASCFSFRASDGRYLRHYTWRVKLDPNDGTALFRGDATFCVREGAAAGSVSLESSNYPGWFLRRRGDQLWVDNSDGTAAFRADSSFRIRPPLTG
jgi:RNA polymerase sigma factor (sigma-70 family)